MYEYSNINKEYKVIITTLMKNNNVYSILFKQTNEYPNINEEQIRI